jgi:hypothetical protein
MGISRYFVVCTSVQDTVDANQTRPIVGPPPLCLACSEHAISIVVQHIAIKPSMYMTPVHYTPRAQGSNSQMTQPVVATCPAFITPSRISDTCPAAGGVTV